MTEFFHNFLATRQFIPHGHCYLWKPGLVGLHILSDSLIAFAYYSIPVMLVYFVHQRRDLPFNWIFLMFGTFIVACGTTHLIEIWTLWHPTYWLSGCIKAITAFVSVCTAAELVPLIPKALALPNPEWLEAANIALEKEIIERQRAEKELQKEQEFLKVLLNNLEAGIVACDAQGVLTVFNQATQKFHGLPEQPLPADQWAQHYSLYLPDGTGMKREDVPLFRALQGECVSNVEMMIVPKHGAARTLLASGQALFDPQGKKLGAVVVMHDISDRKRTEEQIRSLNMELEQRVNQRTAALRHSNQELANEIADRKQAQEALKQSEERFRMLAEKVRMIPWQADAITGNFTYVGPQTIEILGYPLSDWYTKNFWVEHIHPEDREWALKYCLDNSCLLDNYEFEYRMLAADGRAVWLYDIVNVVRDGDKPQVLRGFMIDITERKRVEAQIKASLKEKEVLLKEIHHRVKNNLQIISSLLSLQSGYIEDEKTLEILKAGENRIASMALVHEQLYQSKDLAKINSAEYIENLVSTLFSSYNINLEFICLNLNIDDICIDVDTAIPCGLIINELVSNSLKYAFLPGKNGKICVYFQKYDCTRFILTVSDNGIGFPKNIDFQHTDSLGLQIVTALTNQLGGSIELIREIGTEFKMIF